MVFIMWLDASSKYALNNYTLYTRHIHISEDRIEKQVYNERDLEKKNKRLKEIIKGKYNEIKEKDNEIKYKNSIIREGRNKEINEDNKDKEEIKKEKKKGLCKLVIYRIEGKVFYDKRLEIIDCFRLPDKVKLFILYDSERTIVIDKDIDDKGKEVIQVCKG
ncbi:hypothetical protein RhiirC2_848508 [Rhizophagus irregularis]|uniref:Uncharacterized protein n=1 Tax=Rhizophagus irregularis TaxID=588596 RepID=A0A2N1NEL9_9GLOM|nr:hypothetical protein RhiirC2_848508 [Rhizophagus irregularis]